MGDLLGSNNSSDNDSTDYSNYDVNTTDTNTELIAGLMSYMAEMMAAQSEMTLAASFANQASSLDTTYSAPEVDWTEKTDSLRAMMAADYGKTSDRMTREDTILTSPLLDETEADTTSILGKGK